MTSPCLASSCHVCMHQADRVLFISRFTVHRLILFISVRTLLPLIIRRYCSPTDTLHRLALFITVGAHQPIGPLEALFINRYCSSHDSLFIFTVHRPIHTDVPKSGVNTCPPVSEYNILCSEILLLVQRNISLSSISPLLAFFECRYPPSLRRIFQERLLDVSEHVFLVHMLSSASDARHRCVYASR